MFVKWHKMSRLRRQGGVELNKIYLDDFCYGTKTRGNIYEYVFRAVGCFPGPYLAKRFTKVHIN